MFIKITLKAYRGNIFSREFVSAFLYSEDPKKEFWMLHQQSPQYKLLYWNVVGFFLIWVMYQVKELCLSALEMVNKAETGVKVGLQLSFLC